MGSSKKFRLRSQIFERIVAYTPFGRVGFGVFCFGLLSIICFLGACNRYDMETATGSIGFSPSPDDAVRFNFSFEQPRLFLGEPTTRTGDATAVVGTPPYKTEFVQGDAIGIYVVKHDQGAPSTLDSYVSNNFANNVKVTYDDPGSGTLSWIFEDTIYHPGGGFHLDFYAYYPYQRNQWYGYPIYDTYPPDPNAIPYTASVNQDTPAGFYGNDFVFGVARDIPKTSPAVGSSPTPTVVNIGLKHAMALVEAKVYYDYNEPVDSAAKLTLLNIKSATSVRLSNLSTATADFAPPQYTSRDDSIIMYKRGPIAGRLDTVVYWAVVPEQTIGIGTDVGTVVRSTPIQGTALFVRRDSSYIVTTDTGALANPAKLELKAGKVHTLKVKLK